MASAMLHMSMLPAIKCSTCGADVDLAMMGDHVCAPTSVTVLQTHIEENEPILNKTPEKEAPHSHSDSDHTITKAGIKLSPESTEELEAERPEEETPKQLPRAAPPRIDLQAANDYQPTTGSLLSPSSVASASLSQSTAPLSPHVATPHSDTTISTFGRSPTPEILSANDGESWPRFPLDELPPPPPAPANSASAPSRAPSRAKSLRKKMSNLTIRSDVAYDTEANLAPLSPSVSAGSDVMKRMNLISPGPFQTKHKKSESKDKTVEKSGFGSIFRRKSTKKKSLDKISAPTPIEAPAPPLPIANMFAESTRQLAPPDRASNASKLDNFGHELPPGPAPPRPSRPEGVEGVIEQMRLSNMSMEPITGTRLRTGSDAIPSATLGDLSSPQTGLHNSTEADVAMNKDLPTSSGSTPVEPLSDEKDNSRDAGNQQARITSDASVYTTVSAGDRTTAFGQGLPQISEDDDSAVEPASNGSVPPPAWPAGRLRSLSKSSEKSRPDQVPPVPNLTTSFDQLRQHTPSGSVSSSDARSVFDDRRESSRSSPPTSTTSSFSPRKQSLEDSHNEALSPSLELLPSSSYVRPVASFSRPRAPTESDGQAPLPSKQSLDLAPPQAPKSGSPQRSLSPGPRGPPNLKPEHSPTLSSSSSLLSNKVYAGPGKYSVAPASPMFPPPPPIPQDRQTLPGRPGSKSRRRSETPKVHECRGCGLTIEGKSIKAADGRLTGRWHKECFVCKMCKERFESADFYIIKNEPYCAQHYHTLNGSLCTKCNTGIEGRFLETTQSKQKYHTYCFTCSDCFKPLSKDYFEQDDKVQCEGCASKQHNTSTLLAPGRKFPERRTTKLMMM